LSAFDAEWLALREPVDHRSRSARFRDRVATRFADAHRKQIVDLGAGTGSNFRYLSPVLGGGQYWLCVDHEPTLLDAIRPVSLAPTGARSDTEIDCLVIDLATQMASVELEHRALVTASALLDLVSEEWLRRLASLCEAARATVLFALNYDGRVRFSPPDAFDGALLERVNEHQHRDKGFGAAAGPQATECADRAFAEQGFEVQVEPSDWRLLAGERQLQHALIVGLSVAALEADPEAREDIAAWQARRLALVDAGSSSILVGHRDLLAVPCRAHR
jgi:SAM-dependent methyltransferase